MTRVWEMMTSALIGCGLRLAITTEGTMTLDAYTCLAEAQAQQATIVQSTPKGLYIRGCTPHACRRAAEP